MYPILKMVNKKNFLPSYLLVDDDDVRDELFSALLSLLRAQQVSVSAESSFWKGAMQCTGLSVVVVVVLLLCIYVRSCAAMTVTRSAAAADSPCYSVRPFVSCAAVRPAAGHAGRGCLRGVALEALALYYSVLCYSQASQRLDFSSKVGSKTALGPLWMLKSFWGPLILPGKNPSENTPIIWANPKIFSRV